VSANERQTSRSWLRALGNEDLPDRIDLPEGSYRLDHVFKHDFFAATARYVGTAGQVVVKIGRQAGFCGLPLDWMGRWHANHESGALLDLADVPAVPRFVGRVGAYGFAHEYVAGHPLA